MKIKTYTPVFQYTNQSCWLPDSQPVKSIKDADLIVLEGGEDINPSIYGEGCSRRSYFNNGRDNEEMQAIKEASERGIPVAGICRGAQLLCAINGGKLIQDVGGHHGNHNIQTLEGEMNVSSCHHQMLLPNGIDHALIAWSQGISSHYFDGDNNEIELNGKLLIESDYKEPEIVYFPQNSGAIAIQGHPEWGSCPVATKNYCAWLVEELIGGTIAKSLSL